MHTVSFLVLLAMLGLATRKWDRYLERLEYTAFPAVPLSAASSSSAGQQSPDTGELHLDPVADEPSENESAESDPVAGAETGDALEDGAVEDRAAEPFADG